MRITVLEGTWVVNDNSFLSAKYSDFEDRSILGQTSSSISRSPSTAACASTWTTSISRGSSGCPNRSRGKTATTPSSPRSSRGTAICRTVSATEEVLSAPIGIPLTSSSPKRASRPAMTPFSAIMSCTSATAGPSARRTVNSVSNGWGWIEAIGGLDETDEGIPVYLRGGRPRGQRHGRKRAGDLPHPLRDRVPEHRAQRRVEGQELELQPGRHLLQRQALRAGAEGRTPTTSPVSSSPRATST